MQLLLSKMDTRWGARLLSILEKALLMDNSAVYLSCNF
jgi:hypothetical protein